MMSSDYRCEKKDRCVQNKIFFFFKLLIILCEIFPTVGYGLIIKCWGKTDVSDDDARDIYAVRRRGCQIRSTKPAGLSSLRFHTVNTSYTGVLKWSVRMNLKIIKNDFSTSMERVLSYTSYFSALFLRWLHVLWMHTVCEKEKCCLNCTCSLVHQVLCTMRAFPRLFLH